MGSKALGTVMGHAKRHSHVWKSTKHVGFIIQISKPHFSPRIGGENQNFEGLLLGQWVRKYMLGLGFVQGVSVVRG